MQTPQDEIDFSCTGHACKCAAIQIKTGISMTMDFDKLLEGDAGAGLKQRGITSLADILEMMKNPEVQKSMEADGLNIKEVKNQIKMLRRKMKFSNKLSLYACVNADLANRKKKTYDFPMPAIGGMGDLPAGMTMTAETTAAMTIIDAPKP